MELWILTVPSCILTMLTVFLLWLLYMERFSKIELTQRRRQVDELFETVTKLEKAIEEYKLAIDLQRDSFVEQIDDCRSTIALYRDAICDHRDAKGNNRCHLNDRKLYAVLGDDVEADFTLSPLEEFIPECIRYHVGQCAEKKKTLQHMENQ